MLVQKIHKWEGYKVNPLHLWEKHSAFKQNLPLQNITQCCPTIFDNAGHTRINHEATAASVNSKAMTTIAEHYKLYLWVENHTFYNSKEIYCITGTGLVFISPNVKPSLSFTSFLYRLKKFSKLGQTTWNQPAGRLQLRIWQNGHSCSASLHYMFLYRTP